MKTCPDCVYYNAPDSTCRHNSPSSIFVDTQDNTLYWPPVKITDWCGEGYNPTDGHYHDRG